MIRSLDYDPTSATQKDHPPNKQTSPHITSKVGPLPVITGLITPITRVIRTVSHLFSAIYRGHL